MCVVVLAFLVKYFISDQTVQKFEISYICQNAGPRVFMDCAVDGNRNELETWFLNLWNHFVIPYLMGAIMAGIEVGAVLIDAYLTWCCFHMWVGPGNENEWGYSNLCPI